MNSSKMNVESVDSRPRNMLMHPTATKAVLGTLNKYETGYIIGVMAQLASPDNKLQFKIKSTELCKHFTTKTLQLKCTTFFHSQ